MYWIRGNYRVKDNQGLSVAMWLSTELRLPLQASGTRFFSCLWIRMSSGGVRKGSEVVRILCGASTSKARVELLPKVGTLPCVMTAT